MVHNPSYLKEGKRFGFLKLRYFVKTQGSFLEEGRGLVGEEPERLVEGEVTKVCYTYVQKCHRIAQCFVQLICTNNKKEKQPLFLLQIFQCLLI